jgi:hypothetical protein
VIDRYLELLNGGLGLALLILAVIIIKDFNKEFYSKTLRFQMFAASLLLGIVALSVNELYKYGPLDFSFDPVVAELLETLYFILTIVAAFILMGMRKIDRDNLTRKENK